MRVTMTDKSLFLLRRAEEEAILAIRSDQAATAAIHDLLALRYSERAIEALVGEEEGTRRHHAPERVIMLQR